MITVTTCDWPSWAQFKAMARDGIWHFYEFEPVCLRTIWGATHGRTRQAPPAPMYPNWRDSLISKAP